MSDDPAWGMADSDDETRVECDEACGALLDPTTEAELRAALEHWRSHHVLAGCSHGR